MDAGPLVALLDPDEPDHVPCRDLLPTLSGPLLSSWPVLSEAMFLLARAGGRPAQRALWRLVLRGDLILMDLGPEGRERAAELMERYRDVPMALADATLVALAEQLALPRIFTLDGDFRIYRYRRRGSFDVVP